MVSMKLVTAELAKKAVEWSAWNCDSLAWKEDNRVVIVKLESTMNTVETSVNVKKGS